MTHSIPTRRSSDLAAGRVDQQAERGQIDGEMQQGLRGQRETLVDRQKLQRQRQRGIGEARKEQQLRRDRTEVVGREIEAEQEQQRRDKQQPVWTEDRENARSEERRVGKGWVSTCRTR